MNTTALYFDKRYTITKQIGENKYIPNFCNIALHNNLSSVESCLIRAKSHQIKQVFKGLRV